MHTYVHYMDSVRLYVYVSISIKYTCIYVTNFFSYVHILCVRFTDDNPLLFTKLQRSLSLFRRVLRLYSD